MTAVFVESATAHDLGDLVALEARCFSHPWPEAAFRAALADTGHTLLLVARDRTRAIVAYAVLQVVVDEVQVHDFAVAPEERGQGLGQRLLRQSLDLAARRGAQRAFLEVRASNGPALRLYRGAGFRTVGLRRDYYDAPREDALVLAREGLAVPS